MPTQVKTFDKLSDSAKVAAREEALRRGIRPEELNLVLDTDDKGNVVGLDFEKIPSKTGAMLAEGAASVLPTTAGIATGTALVPTTGGLLSFAGGAGAGMVTGKAQDWALRKISPNAARYLDIARQTYPKLTTAAQAVGAVAGQKQLLLNKGALLSKAGLDAVKRGGISEVGKMAVREAGGAGALARNLGIGAAAGVGFEGYQQAREGDLDLGRLTTAAIANAIAGGGAPRRGTLFAANLGRKAFGGESVGKSYTTVKPTEEAPLEGQYDSLKKFADAYNAEADAAKRQAIWQEYSSKNPYWSSPEAAINTAKAVAKREEGLAEAKKKAEEAAKKEAEQKVVEEKKAAISKEFDVTKVVPETEDIDSRIVNAHKGYVYDGVKLTRDIVKSMTPEAKAKALESAVKLEAAKAAEEAKAKADKEAAKAAKPEQPKTSAAQKKVASLVEAMRGVEMEPTKTGETPAPVEKTAEEKLAALEKGIRGGEEKLKKMGLDPAVKPEDIENLSKRLDELVKLYKDAGGNPDTALTFRTKVWKRGNVRGPDSSELHRYVQLTEIPSERVKEIDEIGRTEWSKAEGANVEIDPEVFQEIRGAAIQRIMASPDGMNPENIAKSWNTARREFNRRTAGKVDLTPEQAQEALTRQEQGQAATRTTELEDSQTAGRGIEKPEAENAGEIPLPAAEAPAPTAPTPKPAKTPKPSKTGQVFKPGDTVILSSKLGNRPVKIINLKKATADVEDIENGGKIISKVHLSKLSPKSIETANDAIRAMADEPDAIERVAEMPGLSAESKADIIAQIRKFQKDKTSAPAEPSPKAPPIPQEAPAKPATAESKTGQQLGIIPQPSETAKKVATAIGTVIGKTEKGIRNIAKGIKRTWDESLTADSAGMVGKAGSADDVLNAENVYNDLKNNIHKDELQLLDDAGFKEFMTGKKTRGEISDWLQENGPKIKTVVLTKDSTIGRDYESVQKEVSEAMHELDTKFPGWQDKTTEEGGVGDPDYKITINEGVPKSDEFVEAISKFSKLAAKYGEALKATDKAGLPQWEDIAPKPRGQIPGYAEIAVTTPGKVKFGSSHNFPDNTLSWVRGYMETLPTGKKAFRVIEVQSDWASAQNAFELRPGKNGKGWQIYNADNNVPVNVRRFMGEDSPIDFPTYASREQAQEALDDFLKSRGHPLLSQYNRLALKAAISHAKKQGADYLVIDDAETAMLTERHDRAARAIKRVTPKQAEEYIPTDGRSAWGKDWESGTYALVTMDGRNTAVRIDKPSVHRNDSDERLAEAIAAEYPNGEGLTYEGEVPFIKQEKGMRFHYDPAYRVTDNSGQQLTEWTFPTSEDAQAWARANRVRDYKVTRGMLHRIATELTGDEGLPGRFGGHKEAFQTRERLAPGEPYEEPRKDLIFTDLETGQPKTTSTGRVYSLDRTEPPSLFGTDKVPTGPVDHNGILYCNPFGVMWKPAIKAVGKTLDFADRWAFRPWMGGEFEKARTLPSNPTEKDKARATAAETLRSSKADYDREFVRLNNQFQRTIDDSLKGESFTDDEIRKVTQHADFINDLGSSPIVLTPKEQKLFDAFDRTRIETAGERISNGPLINGKRLLKPDPNWSMHAIMDKRVRDILTKNAEGADKYRNDYIDWYMVHNPKSTREQAGKFLDEILGKSEVKSSGTGPTAATLRKAEGIGLPPSMREKSIVNRMRWNAHITAADLAWHRNIEQNPQVAVMLGLTDDGKGNVYPQGIDSYTAPTIAANYMLPDMGYGQHISINRRGEGWVEAAIREMELPRRVNSTSIEQWTSLANSMNLGTWTAARDVAGSFGILSGWLKPSEMTAVVKAMRNLVTGNSSAVLKGQVRGKKAAEFYAQDIYRNALLKVSDVLRKYQGRDLIEKGLREVIAEVGNIIAPKRLAGALKGDAADVRFMDEMAGRDWRDNVFDPTAHAKMMDRIGQRFVDTVQGNYSIDYLPAWLSRSEQGLMKSVLTLSRWSFERARRFKGEIVKPMVESGDIKPLLKQTLGYAIGAAGIDTLSEYILDRKPRDMSWSEFFGLTTEEKKNELTHMLAGKSAIMGMGGIFAQMADFWQQAKHGEAVYPMQNPALRFAGDVLHKVIAYTAAHGGPFDGSFWSNIASLPYETFMDEVQLPRMIRQGLRNQEESGTREEQMLKRVSGMTKPGLSTIKDADPFSPIAKIKKAQTPEEAASLEGELYGYYSRNRQLRPTSLPGNLERRLTTGYYPFVQRIQGSEKAGQRFEYDKKQEALNQLRKAVVARAWYGAEINRRAAE